MKICFIAPKAYPLFNSKIESTFGGAEVQLYLLSKELAKDKSLEIYFMVADYGQRDKENIYNIQIQKSLNFKDNKLKQMYNFFKIFNKINADIYIQRTLTIQSGLIALYCKIKKKKFVYMVAHDSESDQTHDIYKNKIKSFFANLTFKYADKIIVQNEYQKRNIQKYKNRRSLILNSSYEINNFKNKKKRHILWVGRSEKWKRPELLLELAKLNPKEKFIMICPPSTNNAEFSKIIKNQAEKINNLEFHSFIPFDKINNFFKKSKLYISTSKQEGFQNTLIQSAKNKTPILSLNVNPNKFITKYNCGFYCKDDFELLNQKLKELLDNQELYNKMSNNAYKYAKDNHNIRMNSKKFLEIIK